MHQPVWMEINGYQLTSLAFMAAGGPLWNATGADGGRALVTLRAPHDGEVLEARWRAWACVTSPHVVDLLDVARHGDGRWAVVMERVEGDTLESLMLRGGLRTREVRERVVEGVERGLGELHAVGLVHGDVSPANVIVRPDGCAVLVDVVDGTEGVEGTPGWGSATAGPEGDLESLGRIAAALGLTPVPPVDAGPVGGSGAGGPPAVIAPAPGGPEPAARLPPPLDPGEVGGAVLRGVGLSEETRRRDAPARHRRPRARGRVLGAVLVLVAAAAAAGVVPLRAFLFPAGPVASPLPGASAPCPPDEELREVFTSLVAVRDTALAAGDRDALGAAAHEELVDADLEVLGVLEASGTTVHDLATEVGPVEGVTCEEDRVRFVTSLRQLPHRRCAEGRCRDVPGGEVRGVEVTVSQDPWRVVSLESSG